MAEITRQDLRALITPQISSEIIKGAINSSAVLQYFRRLPNMTSNQLKMSVLDNLPLAYWQSSDTSFKKTTTMAWANKYITAEELAVIIPIAINAYNDTGIDLWAEIRPQLEAAFGRKIDQAVLMGIDKPQSFRLSLVDTAINSGNKVTATTDLYKDLNKAMELVEVSGYDPTAIMGSSKIKSKFRSLVDSSGQPILGTEISSLPRIFVKNDSWDSNKAEMIIGDFTQAVYSIRQDITFDVFEEGTIIDPATKEVMYSLMQQDMVAIRAVMRFGWEVPNPINSENPDNSTRFPFSVIVPSTAETTYDVTFTVKDNATTPAAIKDATVIFSGVEKTTDASGKAIFKVPANTKATYAVTSAGKAPVMGKLEVESANKSIDITLLGE